MKALKIKKSGWMWKLASEGGMSNDGMVADKANAKFNRLQRMKYDADEINYGELVDSRLDPERPIDFCDFTRFLMLGAMKFLLLAAFILILLAAIAYPVLSFLWWAVSGLYYFHWVAMSDAQKWGCFLVVITSGTLSVAAAICYRDKIADFIFSGIKKSDMPYRDYRVVKAQAAYDRAEVRKALFQSLKGKTCFKMDVSE